MKNKKGLTLFEILVSVVILALVVTGLANVFVAGKKYVQHNKMRMSGGEVGKYFLDPIQNDVNASTWTTNGVGTGAIPTETKSIDGKSYTGTYTVSNDSPLTNINKVKVEVKWARPE